MPFLQEQPPPADTLSKGNIEVVGKRVMLLAVDSHFLLSALRMFYSCSFGGRMRIGNSSEEKDASKLVFIGNKNGEDFRCRHKDVLSWEYDEDKDPGHIEIIFRNQPEQLRRYRRERVALYSEKERYEGKWYVFLVDDRRVSFKRALLLEPDIEHAPKLIRLVKEDGFEKDYPANKVAVVAKVNCAPKLGRLK